MSVSVPGSGEAVFSRLLGGTLEFAPGLSFGKPRDTYPGRPTDTIIRTPTGYRVGVMQWGIVPEWGGKLIHIARGEKYTGPLPSMWSGFKRCILPMTGFYEWEEVDGLKYPICFR